MLKETKKEVRWLSLTISTHTKHREGGEKGFITRKSNTKKKL
jgi:hypothetical protein